MPCPSGTQSTPLANDITDCVTAPGFYGPNGKARPTLCPSGSARRLRPADPRGGGRARRQIVPVRQLLPDRIDHAAGLHPPTCPPAYPSTEPAP
jgi:hypothetical protein